MSAIQWNEHELRNLLASSDVARDVQRRAVRVESRAKTLCPIDTGLLRGSITYEVVREFQLVYAKVGSNVEYARYVHDGTRFMGGRFYLTKALPAAA